MFYGTVEYQQGMNMEEFAREVEQGLLRYKVLHITGVDPNQDLRAFYDALTDALGECYLLAEDAVTNSRTGEKWMEVRFDPSIPNAYRHSANPQPLHTDGSYIGNQAPLTFMFCINRAPSGGETTFVDSDDLIALLQEHDPELLRELREVEIHFARTGDEKRRRIIDEDDQGTRLNWNYYCLAPGQDERVENLRQRFFDFNERVVMKSDRVLAIPLDPGEAVAFKDERILHGRNGFVAHQVNDRHLMKAMWAPRVLMGEGAAAG